MPTKKPAISPFLQKTFKPTGFSVFYRMGILGRNGKHNYTRSSWVKDGLTFLSGLGCDDFISHEKLFKIPGKFVVDGMATFFCDVNCF